MLRFLRHVARCLCFLLYTLSYSLPATSSTHQTYSFRSDIMLLCCYAVHPQAQDMLRNIYLASCGILFLIGLAQLAANMNFQSSKTLWGSTCVAILAVYYTAPLSSLAKVTAQRDSSSLHWPLCTMNIINGMLWFAYGLVRVRIYLDSVGFRRYMHACYTLGSVCHFWGVHSCPSVLALCSNHLFGSWWCYIAGNSIAPRTSISLPCRFV